MIQQTRKSALKFGGRLLTGFLILGVTFGTIPAYALREQQRVEGSKSGLKEIVNAFLTGDPNEIRQAGTRLASAVGFAPATLPSATQTTPTFSLAAGMEERWLTPVEAKKLFSHIQQKGKKILIQNWFLGSAPAPASRWDDEGGTVSVVRNKEVEIRVAPDGGLEILKVIGRTERWETFPNDGFYVVDTYRKISHIGPELETHGYMSKRGMRQGKAKDFYSAGMEERGLLTVEKKPAQKVWLSPEDGRKVLYHSQQNGRKGRIIYTAYRWSETATGQTAGFTSVSYLEFQAYPDRIEVRDPSWTQRWQKLPEGKEDFYIIDPSGRVEYLQPGEKFLFSKEDALREKPEDFYSAAGMEERKRNIIFSVPNVQANFLSHEIVKNMLLDFLAREEDFYSKGIRTLYSFRWKGWEIKDVILSVNNTEAQRSTRLEFPADRVRQEQETDSVMQEVSDALSRVGIDPTAGGRWKLEADAERPAGSSALNVAVYLSPAAGLEEKMFGIRLPILAAATVISAEAHADPNPELLKIAVPVLGEIRDLRRLREDEDELARLLLIVSKDISNPRYTLVRKGNIINVTVTSWTPAAGLEEIRDRINLLPVVQTQQASVGVIAGPVDERALVLGTALLRRGRTSNREIIPVVFLVESQKQIDFLQGLGVSPEVMYRIGSAEYPTREDAVREATNYLRQGLGIDHIVSLGVTEKISPILAQVLENLFGIQLDANAAKRWKEVIDAVVYTFQQV